jgi:tryptophan-rich hypothetical protein
MQPGPAPRHPGRLVGSKWTSRDDELPYRHWVVTELTDGQVVLQSVLCPGMMLRRPWRELRERPRWQPGWA